VEQASRHSYVIAFETSEPDANPKNNRPRKLKVRVKRPGLSVSHRPEYSPAVPRPTGAAAQMLASEAISKGLTGGPLRLHLQTIPYRDAGGRESVQAVLHIDGPSLAEGAVGPAMAVQVFGYAMSGGRVVDGLALNTSVDLSRFGPVVRTSGISVLTAFPVEPGRIDLRFFVRAGSADLSGSIQRDVAVPAFSPGERVVSSPLFMLPPEGRLVVPFQPKGRPAIPIPFYAGESRFVPDSVVTLTAGQARDVCVLVWRGGAGSTAPFSVTGEIVHSGEEPRPVQIEGLRVSPEADGFDRYLIRLAAPKAAPGVYRLRLSLIESGTGRAIRSETEVEIEG
jgi:hypothetical protein